ncbi:pro-resilin-like [Macrosteles quadrilineatus]|uniref:pro-resilin-like n=1 Tax=Macrosteles quadrilineatus TaxID=74068 RepID=UPI0023E27959|nr:pro-resilin-like [Macrosteles quadrilineatus]
MAKVLLVIASLTAVTLARPEPPVNNQYLPPGLQTEASFGGSPSSQYGAPSSQYGAPSSNFGAPSSQYGAPSGGFGGGRPSSSYGAPRPSRPSNQYGAPNSFGGSSSFGGPSSSYGAPSSSYGAPSSQYGAPGGGYGGNKGGYDEGPSEPANYEFRYDVDAPEYNVKFGHQEARQGDVAQGKYYVLLPDGRTQLVEYTADQDGYHPKITYEGTANNGGGYGRGPSGNGGYQY